MTEDLSHARDHLANERTFLAWLRSGIALVIFGFAIGRFAIAIRQFTKIEGHAVGDTSFSVWFGMVAMIGGVVLILAGLLRYRHTRAQIDSGSFETAGSVIDLVASLTALFGLVLTVYLIYVGLKL